MFTEIPGSEAWTSIAPITKGWSHDQKYRIQLTEGRELLLRNFPLATLPQRQREYDFICLVAELKELSPEPLGFGVLDDGQSGYMLLSYIPGVDLEERLAELEEEKQYSLGQTAGKLLRKIHQLPLPAEHDSGGQNRLLYEKKAAQLAGFKASSYQLPQRDAITAFVEERLEKMLDRPNVYQHGDFHPGNLILTAEGNLGVIDFNRWDIGDPYEEFYKLMLFTKNWSVPFATGQLAGYFDGGDIPAEFWQLVKLYSYHAALTSLVWAEQFDAAEVAEMMTFSKSILTDYADGGLQPLWYRTSSFR